jgi:nucleoid DNA-binding protein
MLNLQTQTYFNRSVNGCSQYNHKDFIDKIREQSGDNDTKMDKFIDRVSFRIEEALQSNELINVF